MHVRVGTIAACAAFAAVGSACAEQDASPERTEARVERAPDARADLGGSTKATTVELARGQSRVLVRIRAGTLEVACSRRGTSVTFTAALWKTMAVTVSSARHGVVRRWFNPPRGRIRLPASRGPDVQTWQLAPFAKSFNVTTIWVSTGKSAGRGRYECGASAYRAAEHVNG